MKILGGISNISEVYNKQTNVNKTGKISAIASKKDIVSISGEAKKQAKDFQLVMNAVRNVPDVRNDKVNDLIDKYESGQYDVRGEDIADKILKSITEK